MMQTNWSNIEEAYQYMLEDGLSPEIKLEVKVQLRGDENKKRTQTSVKMFLKAMWYFYDFPKAVAYMCVNQKDTNQIIFQYEHRENFNRKLPKQGKPERVLLWKKKGDSRRSAELKTLIAQIQDFYEDTREDSTGNKNT